MHIYIWTSIRAIILWRLKALYQRLLKLLSGNGFHSLGHCDLDLCPTDPKINRGLQLNKGYHAMKVEGSGSKGTQLLSGNEVWQTDGRTDGQGKNNMSPPEDFHLCSRTWQNFLVFGQYFIVQQNIVSIVIPNCNWHGKPKVVAVSVFGACVDVDCAILKLNNFVNILSSQNIFGGYYSL